MFDRRHTRGSTLRPVLLVVLGLWAFAACGETVVQIDPDDAVELRVSVDSAGVMVGRTFDVDAFPLDVDGALLVGQDVTWSSTNESVATVDGDGVVTGVSAGTANVVAQMLALRDTTFVTVDVPPALVLSADSVGFEASAGGADPDPDSISVSNGGAFDLVASVDSILYVTGASGWLTAQLDAALAPANLVLSAATSGITAAGTSRALVWLSGIDADDSPAAVEVTLRIIAANPATMTLNDGNNQTRTVGANVTVAPSVLVRDAYSNPAVGATVTFAVTGGGGQITGASALVDASGIARLGSWTLGTTAGANQLTATLGILAPVVFGATGTPGAATQVVVTGGNNQSAVAGSAVGVPPSVSVQDQFGNGVPGVAVTFAVTSGGGSITGPNQTSGTGGAATVGSWTLGAAAGPNTLSATAAGVGTPAVITATGLSGAADSIFAQAGNAQIDTVAATLPVAYAVKVVDSNGNGVAGIPVTWTVTFGGSITPLDTTDAQGVATAIRVLGTVPGPDSATASVGGLPGSPVRFAATATVGSPAVITVTDGNAQTDTVNQVVPIDPQVRVADKFDNPILGNLVTFAVTGGGGTVVPTTAIATLADGTATVTSWQLGTAAGTNNNTLSATAAGVATPATLTASATAGAPSTISIVQGGTPQQTATTGTNVGTNPTVVVRDQYANPISGRTVNFSASGSGTVGSSAPSTNASGQASTTWAVNVGGHSMATNGTYQNTLTATVSGTAISTSFTGYARYSWATHVNPIWSMAASGTTSTCLTCHGGTSGGFSGLSLGGNATQNYTMIVGVTLTCDDPNNDVDNASYRRVETSTGTTGRDRSFIWRFMQANPTDQISTCGPHSTKATATNITILEAWIRNGAPNN